MAYKTYDNDNIFAKILRKEIPCDIIFENNHVIAFKDLHPKAPIHLLALPKGAYVDMSDFTNNASTEEIAALFRAVGELAKTYGINDSGYRIISNCGIDGGQEIPHLHIHILGGKQL